MPKETKIRWTNSTWNPVTGCTQVSPGCDNCYAMRFAEPKRGTPAFPVGFDIQLRAHKLNEPKKWKQPARIFVNSMSDLFHREIPDEYLEQIWETMLREDRHTYQILTKRAHRMAYKIKTLGLPTPSHIWLGVSAENQSMADSRIPALLTIGCATPWVSAEPLLGPVDLSAYISYLRWVVAGGESGPLRRPMDYDWARSLRDQCLDAAIPFFYKQGNAYRSDGDKILDGVTWDQYPSEEVYNDDPATETAPGNVQEVETQTPLAF